MERQGNLNWQPVVLGLCAAIALFSRFLHASFYGFFEDDFFYYALVARQLVLAHLSSADGVHLTNGYHPLWLLIVAACYGMFPGIFFFIAVQAVALVAILVYYFGVLRCLTAFAVPPKLRNLAALALSLHALLLFRFGMEVTLALPLGVWTLAFVLSPSFRWSAKQTLVYGLLACLTTLARLDSILLFALLMALQTLTAGVPWSERLRRVAIFCCGWLPFAFYLGLNLHVFHTLLPISGAAKQLKPLWPLSSFPLQTVFLPPDRTKLAFVYPALLLLAACAFVFLRRLRRPLQPEPSRAVLAALFLFPLLHIGLLCILSDWATWPWYFYSLCYAALAAAAVLLQPLEALPRISTRVARPALLAIASAFAAYLCAYAVFKKPPYKVLTFVSGFAQQHPGIYAMGDGSGTPAFIAGQPFIQLEGLMMDAEYIRLLRQRTPLADALRRYHVDYYVSFVDPHHGSCFSVAEPAQAGRYSPRMSGRICVPPIASIDEGPARVEIYHASDVLLP